MENFNEVARTEAEACVWEIDENGIEFNEAVKMLDRRCESMDQEEGAMWFDFADGSRVDVDCERETITHDLA